MLFSWWKRRRRRRLISQPFPDEWRAVMRHNVVLSSRLSPEQQRSLEKRVQVFVAEKNWEGCNGVTVTDEMKVTIAAQACLLVLAFDGE